MMPATVNVNWLTTHRPNTSPDLTYAAYYNTSGILRLHCRPSTTKVGDKSLLSISIFVQAARNNVLLAVPALLYAIKNYIIRGAITVAKVAASVAAIAYTTTTSSITRRDELMAKTGMDVASAATVADAQCMEAAEVSSSERESIWSLLSVPPSMFAVLPEISDTHCR